MSLSFTPAEAAHHIAVPLPDDDKYSRGVLGFVTGSTRYPGAAVLGVDAALHTGLGMVRYLGPVAPTDLVLHRRPEAVTAQGRVQAWVLGSGIDAAHRGARTTARIRSALAEGVPAVVDSGALDMLDALPGPLVVTPHYRELARMTGRAAEDIAADPAAAAARTATELGVTVLLKGHTTHVASAGGTAYEISAAPPWLATAGAGDALAGVLGALLATHAELIENDPDAVARLAATAALVHGLAAERASAGGPFTVLGLTAALPATIAALLGEHSRVG